ncbi:hypothetical protein GGR54DRAFT_569308 [Hypoxylon sp. NC1633]|nr:hypothetical protein GGR54DRAFT_569308 [Hypoxylon sp. NC1633]
MREAIKRILSAVLLGVGAVFLIVGIAHKPIATSGIVKIKLELPQLSHRRAFDPPDITQLPSISQLPDMSLPSEITQLPDVTGLPVIPSEVKSIASNVASRVSEGVSQATGAVGSLLDKVPQEATIRTVQICLIAKGNTTDCRDLSPDISTWFPSPINSLLDLNSIAPRISAVLRINVRACLIAALVGVVLLGILRVALSIIDVGSLGILSLIFGRRTLVEAACVLLILIPLILASVITFSIPSLLRQVGPLTVEDGDMVWCLGIALGMAVLGITVQHLSWF